VSEKWPFVNYLDTGNITENRISEIQHLVTGQDTLPSRARRKVAIDDILYSTVRPNQRHYGIVKEVLPNMLVSTGFAVITPDKSKTDADFLYYYLSQNDIVDGLHSIGEQSVSAYPSIKPSDIESLEMLLPPLPEQVEIGRTLRALDDKITNNSKINHHLEQMAQAIFKSWFVDFEPFSDMMPDDWRKGSLGDYVEIKRGGSPRPIQDFLSDSGLRWLKISDVTSLQTPFVLEIKEHIKESGLKKTVFLKSGSLVLSNSATPGIPKILGVDTCIHDGWLYFLKSHFSNEFLYLFFKHIRQDLVALGNGSVFTNLKTDILKTFPVVVPDKKTMRRFDETIAPIFRGLENSTRESVKIAALRDALLPRLMSGELSARDLGDVK
jgi:type I restriction enzyme S subunit